MAVRKSTSRAVTMRDVAKLAGVSQSTVSRILNQTATISISEETCNRVYEAVKTLGYHPNMTARSLRTQQTHMIAVMIADISNPMYHSIVRTVQAIARQRGYDVLIANSDHLYDNELHFIEAMMRRPVDGIIMVPFQLTNDDMTQFIDRTGVPVVTLAWPTHYPTVDTVFGQDEQATYTAIKWLIETKGHQRIGFIGVSQTFSPGERRKQAYLRALAEFHLPVIPEYMLEGDFTIESGQHTMCQLLELPQPPTAVFACNDLMAVGAVDTAREMNFRIPQDVAVVGFDNIPVTTIIRPRLTTIEQNAVEIGEQLANTLFGRIDGTITEERYVYELPCRLIERETT